MTFHGAAFVWITAGSTLLIGVASALMLEAGRGDGFIAWLWAPAVLVVLLLAGAATSLAIAPSSREELARRSGDAGTGVAR